MSKFTKCGLNADWSFEAWHYGDNEPNCVDGDYYIVDLEGDGFQVVQYFPNELMKDDYDDEKVKVFHALVESLEDGIKYIKEKLEL